MECALQAQYSYTPFGERAKIAGAGPDVDLGFAGMYAHARSSLNLTLFRAYDSRLGRWFSRDPMGESAGINLYAYVYNNPTRFIDRLGLDVWIEGAAGLPEFAFHESINVGVPTNFESYYSQSYGMGSGYGAVYEDSIKGGEIIKYAKATAEQDKAIQEYLKVENGLISSYTPISNCRTYSERKFDEILKKFGLKESAPPNRPVDPWSYTSNLQIVVPTTMTIYGASKLKGF